MSAGPQYDTGAPTLEVRIYDGARLLTRELCESEEEAAALVDQWSDVTNLSVVAEDLSSKHGPDDILAPGDPLVDRDDAYSIADVALPGYGTE